MHRMSTNGIRPRSTPGLRVTILTWLAFELACGSVSVAILFHLGKSISFDTLNYEYSAGYEAVHGFGSAFSLPGQFQTYLDPQINSLYYGLISTMDARWADAVIAILQSLSASLLAILVWYVAQAKSMSRWLPVVAGALAGASAVLAPNYVSELGSTFSDSLLALPLVAAVALLFRVLSAEHSYRDHLWSSIAAGILVGTAVSLKFTNAIYGLAIVVAFVVVVLASRKSAFRGMGERLFVIAGLVLPTCSVTAVISLPEAIMLDQRYRDPLFPYFTEIFHSPLLVSNNAGFDPRWIARTPAGLWSHTLSLIAGGDNLHSGISEQQVRSPLMFVCLLIVAVFLVADLVRWRNPQSLFLEMTVLVGYLLWDYVFGYYRYLAPLEISVVSVVVVLVLMHRLQRTVAFGCAAVCIGLSPLLSVYAKLGSCRFWRIVLPGIHPDPGPIDELPYNLRRFRPHGIRLSLPTERRSHRADWRQSQRGHESGVVGQGNAGHQGRRRVMDNHLRSGRRSRGCQRLRQPGPAGRVVPLPDGRVITGGVGRLQNCRNTLTAVKEEPGGASGNTRYAQFVRHLRRAPVATRGHRGVRVPGARLFLPVGTRGAPRSIVLGVTGRPVDDLRGLHRLRPRTLWHRLFLGHAGLAGFLGPAPSAGRHGQQRSSTRVDLSRPLRLVGGVRDSLCL